MGWVLWNSDFRGHHKTGLFCLFVVMHKSFVSLAPLGPGIPGT